MTHPEFTANLSSPILIARPERRAMASTITEAPTLLDSINAFLDSEWWEIAQIVTLVLGVPALVAVIILGRQGVRRSPLLLIGLGLLVASLLLSMVFEDLLPTLGNLPEHRRLPYALAFPGYLVATSLIVYGGWRFVRDVQAVPIEAARPKRSAPGSRRPRAGERAMPPRRSWLPGLLWIGGGFALLSLSASMQHESNFPLGWLWALFEAGA